MKKLKFFKCAHCGNIIVKVVDNKVPVLCCGQVMQELTPNTTDAATEKHVPVVKICKNKVTVSVGSTLHPMLDGHYINFVALQTDSGYTIKHLNAGDQPVATFNTNGETPVAVYEYCNLHGLWVTEF